MGSASYCGVSGGIRWFQLVLDCFMWFKAVPRFSKCGTPPYWHRFDMLIFLQKILGFVQRF